TARRPAPSPLFENPSTVTRLRKSLLNPARRNEFRFDRALRAKGRSKRRSGKSRPLRARLARPKERKRAGAGEELHARLRAVVRVGPRPGAIPSLAERERHLREDALAEIDAVRVVLRRREDDLRSAEDAGVDVDRPPAVGSRRLPLARDGAELQVHEPVRPER